MKRFYFLFLLLFYVSIFFIYDYSKTSFMRPQGLHQWRQSVGAAYAMNYYNYNLNPLETRVYNNLVEEATSDKALAEFPILYYSIAILYKIFGPHEYIFRLFNLFILYLGLFYLMKLLQIVLKNNFWALALTILAFTSATLVYYANSFIPDTTAYAICMMALYQIAVFHRTKKYKFVWFAVVLFSMGGLVKVSSLIIFLAITASFLLEQLTNTSVRKNYPLKNFILPILMPITFSLIWYAFVSFYNSQYGGNISPVAIRPIWKLSAEVINATWHNIWNSWLPTYYHPAVLLLSLISLLFSSMFFKKQNRFLFSFVIFAFLGSTGFFFLFFRSLRIHDYYLIVVFPMIIFSISLAIIKVLQFKKNMWVSLGAKFIIMLFLVFLVYDAGLKSEEKLEKNNWWHTARFHGLADIEPKLREAGIKKFDKVISLPDPSINISLNMMNQPGYTDFIKMNIPVDERIDFQISKGAKYLVLTDSLLHLKEKRAYVKNYMKRKVLTHKNVVVYDLQRFYEQ
jgi:hypothetical protein